jgi:hypothetical protein
MGPYENPSEHFSVLPSVLEWTAYTEVEEPTPPAPLAADRYVALSAMQKAIRRDHEDLALMAGCRRATQAHWRVRAGQPLGRQMNRTKLSVVLGALLFSFLEARAAPPIFVTNNDCAVFPDGLGSGVNTGDTIILDSGPPGNW